MATPMELSKRWLADITSFRRNSTSFLAYKQIEEDEFALDILQALYSEDLGDAIKVMLLTLLQERAAFLHPTPASVEQTVGSLTSILSQTSSEDSSLYRSQLLVTITTILLDCNQLATQPQLFLDFVDQLLDIVSKVNGGVDRILRGTACECLKEIEALHPGLLMRKLEHFYAMSQLEYTHVCQNYMALFIKVLSNSLDILLQREARIVDNEVTDLLCCRKEPLKPLALPDNFSTKMFQLEPKKSNSKKQLPANVDCSELKRALSFLMDHLHLMTTPCVFHTVLELQHCVACANDELPASTFKSVATHLMSTSDPSLFHLVLHLKHKFGSDLMDDRKEYTLLRRLLSCANHPSLVVGHRLLFFRWLQYFPENKPNITSSLPTILDTKLFAAFFPQIFDGQDTTAAKLNILSQCFTTKEIQESAAPTLIGCLLPLQKSIHYGIPGRPARTLYRTMFKYYQQHHESGLRQDIYKCVLNIVQEHPKFAPHTMDFIECIRKVTPQSQFPVELLQDLTTNLITLQPSGTNDNLEFYLMILERAAQETDISPEPNVGFLYRLLQTTSEGSEGNWLLGNAILSVCHSIMRYHDTDNIFKELGDLLFMMFTEYQDLDIRDRARFYYAMITNLSSEKISNILSSTGSDPTQSVTRLVTGGNQFTIAPPVMKLEKSILTLTRISKRIECPEVSCDLLDEYLDAVKSTSFKPVIHMDYWLHYDKEIDVPVEMEKLYALAFHVDTPSNYKPIQDLTLVSLFKETSGKPEEGCQMVTLRFCLLQPAPATMDISIVFSNSGSQTYTCSPDALEVKFSDLFLQLPVQKDVRAVSFTKLWNYILDQQENSINTLCAESVCSLVCSWRDIQETVDSKLKDFIVQSDDNEEGLLVGIFLPPSWHLLFKIKPNQERAVVSIATDNWRILPLVNSYLHQLEKGATR